MKNPKRGKGERKLDCEFYEECLGRAAKEDWKTFNCKSCPYFEPEIKEVPKITEKEENTRICEKCGEKETIQPSSPFCASCIGKAAWKDGKTAKKKVKKAAKNEKVSKDKPPSKKPQQALNTALTIQFNKHPSILKGIEKLADSEIRTVEEEIVYILKCFVEKNP